MLLHVLTGSVGTEGGHNLNAWNKFVPKPFKAPPPQKRWNELLYPLEWPLCTHEMSFLLPHFLKEGRGRLEAYFTRVFNPVWTYPDGFSWIEMLRDENKVGLHAALTPTWSETAWFADYVLPMGFSPERHDLMSQETHGSKWIGFRQPVLRVLQEREGKSSTTRIRRTPEKSGKKMSSGLTCPGLSIPMARWASVSGSNRLIVPDRSSPSMNITDGFSRIPCLVFRRRQEKRA